MAAQIRDRRANARAVANQIRFMRPGLRVRVAFCDLNTPRLEDVVTPGAVVAPFLLADAYHARIDIPRQIASCGVAVRQADVLGEDDRLVAVLHERLAELGVSTSDPSWACWLWRSARRMPQPTPAPPRSRTNSSRALSGPVRQRRSPQVTGLHRPRASTQLRRHGARRVVIAPWFLAPGRLTDRVAKYASAEGIPIAAPLGAHRLVVETVLDRFDAAVAEPVAA